MFPRHQSEELHHFTRINEGFSLGSRFLGAEEGSWKFPFVGLILWHHKGISETNLIECKCCGSLDGSYLFLHLRADQSECWKEQRNASISWFLKLKHKIQLKYNQMVLPASKKGFYRILTRYPGHLHIISAIYCILGFTAVIKGTHYGTYQTLMGM